MTMPTECSAVEGLLARAADGLDALSAPERASLDAHTASCAACRAALADQRGVAGVLRARPHVAVPADLTARIAARLDRDRADTRLLEMANWRAWTVGLVPVAAALMLAAWLGVGTGAGPSGSQSNAITIESTESPTTPAAMFMQPAANSDSLVEAVLTGAVPPATGSGNVR
jgi:anti-sigma factor RsiW